MNLEMNNQQKREKWQESGYDDFCIAHQIPYNNECPECADIPKSLPPSLKGGDQNIKCPSCGQPWDTSKHNACECGATVKRGDQTGGEIAEGNRLIALFDGLQIIPSRHYREMNPALEYYGHMDTYGTVTNLQSQYDLQYDKSWSKLMPILEKIEGIGHKTIIGGGDHWGHYCNIMYSKSKAEHIEHLTNAGYQETKALGQADTKIGAIYSAIVQFIKWHNEQTQSPSPLNSK